MNPQILLVDDNPITRKMVTFALTSKDIDVVQAPDGAAALRLAASRPFDLVLQDVILPDMDGFDLARQLRALAGLRDIPILAFTGLLSKSESVQLEGVSFTDVVTKPIQPSQLLQIVQTHLAMPAKRAARVVGSNQLVVLADDDPVQLKLTSFRLGKMGFRVVCVNDGVEALASLRKRKPDVLVTDVMMPRLDGFGLCATVRQDPSLADLRIVLLSNTYMDVADRELAARAGADQFVLRTPGLVGLADALAYVLKTQHINPGVPLRDSETFEQARVHRALRQLETQVAANAGLTQQCAQLSAQLSILSAISEAIAQEENIEGVLQEMLAACFDAGGISAGALYLWPPNGAPPSVVQVGDHSALDTDRVTSFFGSMPLLESIVRSGQTTALSTSAPADRPEVQVLLARSGLQSALIVPIRKKGDRSGALVMMSKTAALIDDDHIAFGQAIGNQISLALRLARTFAEKDASATALRENKERTVYALGAAHMGVWELDSATDRVTWSETLAPVFGLTPDEAPTTGEAFFSLIHPDDRQALADSVARTIRDDVSYDTEFRVLLPEGGTRWVMGQGRRFRGADGAPLLLGIGMDISERKSLEGQLRQAQKLEAVGQLAGGVAHDFNNLLTAILGYSKFVVDTFEADDPRRADLQEVINAGQRAVTLTKQLLAFSRKQVLQSVAVDLNAVVTGIRQMLGRLIGEHIELVTVLAPDLRIVRADPGQLEQIVMNLVVNARDAMPAGGRVAIETANVELDASYAMQHGTVRPGSYVMLAVTDNGSGMNEQTKERLFEPFFTTKEPGKGTGLGLATVYGIVKQSGGYIWVYSEPGAGTTFKIYLPMADTDQAVQSPGPSDEVTAAGTETVLVVEDEEAVRFLTRVILEKAGYRVFDAPNPQQAEALFEENPTLFDILVTDVIMPGSSGPKLFERLAKRCPRLKVLYVSGYTDDAIVHQGQLEPGVEFLEKPFTADALNRRVREVLDR